MKRHKNWRESLANTIADANFDSFIYGSHDCCLFAADCIFAMTGIDVAMNFRGTYSTKLGAARKMKRFAGGGVSALAERIAEQYGIERIARRHAGDGDIVLVAWPEGPGLGVIFRGRIACLKETGLHYVPRWAAKACWRT